MNAGFHGEPGRAAPEEGGRWMRAVASSPSEYSGASRGKDGGRRSEDFEGVSVVEDAWLSDTACVFPFPFFSTSESESESESDSSSLGLNPSG